MINQEIKDIKKEIETMTKYADKIKLWTDIEETGGEFDVNLNCEIDGEYKDFCYIYAGTEKEAKAGEKKLKRAFGIGITEG